MKNPFLEQQKQLLEMWTDNASKVPGMESYVEMYKNMAQSVEYWENLTESGLDPTEFWKSFSAMPGVESWSNLFVGPMGIGQWSESFDFLSNPMKPWLDIVQTMSNPLSYWENLANSIPGVNVYNDMMELWADLQNPEKFAQDFPKKYDEIMQAALQNFLPAGMGQFSAAPKDLLDALVALYQYLFSPWMKIDEKIFQGIAAGDARAYIDFFKEFQNRYEETFEKVFNMMGMGLNRESNEDVFKLIDAYFKALYAAGELLALIYNTWQDSAKDLVSEYQSLVAEGKSITTFKEFYDLWFKNTEEALEKLFDTDEFAITFGNFSDMYAKYMIANDKVLERMLSTLPIPTKTDMDSLYRTVYDLRKEVRDLNREIKELKKTGKK